MSIYSLGSSSKRVSPSQENGMSASRVSCPIIPEEELRVLRLIFSKFLEETKPGEKRLLPSEVKFLQKASRAFAKEENESGLCFVKIILSEARHPFSVVDLSDVQVIRRAYRSMEKSGNLMAMRFLKGFYGDVLNFVENGKVPNNLKNRPL